MNPSEMAHKKQAGEFDFDPQIEHHFSDGLYAKQMVFPPGAQIVGHRHNYSHLSILARGEVLVWVDNEHPVRYTAPACIEIKAGTHHAIYAMRESVWYCIHATEATEADEVDEVLIQRGNDTEGGQ